MQDKNPLEILRQYYEKNGILPTHRGFATLMEWKSTNSAYKAFLTLMRAGYLRKIEKRFAPTDSFFKK